MRALIIEQPRTAFMQACDLFEPFKVLYYQIVLDYRYKDDNDKEVLITDEEDLVMLAKHEFGDTLIALLGATEAKYVNEKIKVLSNGSNWTLLDKYIKSVYENR